MSLIAAENLSKEYQAGEVKIAALKGLTFAIEPASFVSFVGPSGSGKTTLLNLIGCLDKPSQGTTNLEIHGEFSLINNFTKMTVDANGGVTQNTYNAVNALLGLRYLTPQDTTYILELYRNGQGYSSREMTDFFPLSTRAMPSIPKPVIPPF
jgi:ABC-type dipeptide/oligopeptide/nickel transport system ATPase subunit